MVRGACSCLGGSRVEVEVEDLRSTKQNWERQNGGAALIAAPCGKVEALEHVVYVLAQGLRGLTLG